MDIFSSRTPICKGTKITAMHRVNIYEEGRSPVLSCLHFAKIKSLKSKPVIYFTQYLGRNVKLTATGYCRSWSQI